MESKRSNNADGKERAKRKRAKKWKGSSRQLWPEGKRKKVKGDREKKKSGGVEKGKNPPEKQGNEEKERERIAKQEQSTMKTMNEQRANKAASMMMMSAHQELGVFSCWLYL